MSLSGLNVGKRVALLLLGVSLAVSLSYPLWCHLIHLFGTDLCWLLHAEYDELQRAFDTYYVWAYFFTVMFKYGMVLCSVGLVLAVWLKDASRSNLMLALFSTCLTLVLAECALRVVGYRPGQYTYSQWAHPVDSVYLLKGFTTDAHGIFKVDTAVYHELENRLTTDPLVGILPHYLNYTEEILQILRDHRNIPKDLDQEHFPFPGFLRHPINAEGFYSIPFDTVHNTRSVLLLGDSFTWGHSSSHKLRSFSNILLRKGYLAYNTGISGTDVQQYERVLRAYYDRLLPDVVILNFFVGNDVAYFKRSDPEHIPIMYHTNAGNINSMQLGVEFSTMDSAYQNLEGIMRIPQNNRANRLLSRTVITTFLWEFLVKQKRLPHTFFKGRDFPNESITNELMQPIIGFCDSVGVPLIIVAIPELEDGKLLGVGSVKGLFRNIRYFEPKMELDMYDRSDGHFNDRGHAFYAEYLQQRIDSCFKEMAHD